MHESPFADAVLNAAEFEQIQILQDREAGLLGFIAIHDTRLGPAFGGIRRCAYDTPSAALADAVRLAAHMTLKCAIHGIPAGGGKAVLMHRPGMDRAAAYRRLGDYVEAMAGRFYTGPDVGTEPSDLLTVRSTTRFVARPGPDGPGNLAVPTALGVCSGIRAVARCLGFDDLDGVRIVVQGLGAVGRRLAGLLIAAGAHLKVADIVPERAYRGHRRPLDRHLRGVHRRRSPPGSRGGTPRPDQGGSRPWRRVLPPSIMTTTDFRHRLRVRYAETDTGGVAHHGSYPAWLEEARTEWMRARGVTYREVEESGCLLMVIEINLRYLSPARYDDELEISVHVNIRKKVSLDLGYEITRVADQRLIARAMTRLACTDRQGKVRRLPESV